MYERTLRISLAKHSSRHCTDVTPQPHVCIDTWAWYCRNHLIFCVTGQQTFIQTCLLCALRKACTLRAWRPCKVGSPTSGFCDNKTSAPTVGDVAQFRYITVKMLWACFLALAPNQSITVRSSWSARSLGVAAYLLIKLRAVPPT